MLITRSKKYALLALLLLAFYIPTSSAKTNANGEYAFVAKQANGQTYDQYLTSIGAPSVTSGLQCPKQGKGDCWPVIKNNQNRVLKSFATSSRVTPISTGRYKNIAYLYFSEAYPSGDKTLYNYYLIDNRGKLRKTSRLDIGALATRVSSKGEILVVRANGIYKDGKQILSAAAKTLEFAQLGSNPEGKLAVIGIDIYGEVHVSDLNRWLATDVQLTRKGDRKGVLSIYPAANELHFAVYKYVNSYNKGLIYGRANLTSQQAVSGWLFNSEQENIGFDPSIYQQNNLILVTANNSTKKETASFHLPLQINEQALADTQPEHIQGYEREKNLELLIGTGLASMDWKSKVEVDKDSTTYAKTSYDLSKSLYKSLWFQGKWGNQQLALSYAKNEADRKGSTTRQASRLLNVVFDANQLFSARSSLRLTMDQSRLGGVATMKIIDSSPTALTSLDNAEFETNFKQYSALVIRERGLYWGLMYENYKMPGLLGFSNSSKRISYLGYDAATGLDKYGLVVGYDEMDYIKRYENNISRFYFDGLVGVGFVKVKVGSDLKNAIKDKGKKLKSASAFSLDGKLDLGYVHQRKIKRWQGVGYLLNAGYRLKASYMGSGQSKDSKNSIKANELELEFGRFDLWHGLYANASLVF